MGKLNLLHHKSYHPYKAENVAKVLADEAKAALIEEESDRKSMLADSEARLDRMRKKSKKKEREGQGEGEKELERQLKGKSAIVEENGSRIIRSDIKGKGREMGPPESTSNDKQHINFWKEFESGGKTTTVNLESAIEKSKEIQSFTDQTKIYLAKKGEGDPLGWYASKDGKSEVERKQTVEVNLEKAYKDGEHKRLSDPLATMNSYLQRRTDILTGKPSSSASNSSSYRGGSNNRREFYPTPFESPLASSSSSSRSTTEIITPLLIPRRRKGEIPTSFSSSTSTSSTSTSSHQPSSSITDTTSSRSIQQESLSRTTSERSRAKALIRAAKSSNSSTTSSSSNISNSNLTPTGSESGFGFYNKNETRDAGDLRRRGGNVGGGGWMERKEVRRGREESGSYRWGGR